MHTCCAFCKFKILEFFLNIRSICFYTGDFSLRKSTFCLFTFSNRVGHLHGERFTWDLVCAISPHTPPKKSNRISHSHGWELNATLASRRSNNTLASCKSQKSLTCWDCVTVILAKSSPRKSRYRTGSLTRSEIVSKRGLLVLNSQKSTTAKALQMRRLSAFAIETITLRNFEKKTNEVNTSVKRNTVIINNQLMSTKLAMKMQGKRWSRRAECCACRLCDT